MTDVRLTATNPEDSSVVAVACNAKGELKLEEIPPFDGRLEGNLTVTGTSELAGNLTVNDYISIQDAPNAGLYFQGDAIKSATSARDNYNNYLKTDAATGNLEIVTQHLNGSGPKRNSKISFVTQSAAQAGAGTSSTFLVLDSGAASANFNECSVKVDGSATFANGKAGFTAEGYLWCTTERGDTVMLEATVGGAGMWREYTPPLRREDIVIRPMPGDLPNESSQDRPDTRQ